MSATLLQTIPSIVTTLSLAWLLLPSPVNAGPSKSTPGTLELAIRTLDGKQTTESREFVLPMHGELAGTILLFEQSHWCRLGARESRNDHLSVDLTCYRGGRAREHVSFQFVVERKFEVGVAMVLGELTVREGKRVQVVATLR